ncbi:ROK family protein [Brucella anthropi]|uniref:ROK family protein n=1 Tax=Brucella anthropi TaxID=529 RepID=UPI00124DC856|nr:ROK family protein [Brucella anthropi]KAB2793166.1 ROK family protein [Brucella anthropi]
MAHRTRSHTTEWGSLSVGDFLSEAVGVTSQVFNDSSAACFGDLFSGSGRGHPNAFYVYVGTFLGGGMALGSSLLTVENGISANIAAMPVRDRSGSIRQLMEIASLGSLEMALETVGNEDVARTESSAHQAWLLDAAHGIAQVILSAAAFFQPSLAVVDGTFPSSIRDQLTAAVRRELDCCRPDGLTMPQVVPGQMGRHAVVVGAARLSMSEIFLPMWLFDQT